MAGDPCFSISTKAFSGLTAIWPDRPPLCNRRCNSPAFTIIFSANGLRFDMILMLRTALFWMHLAIGGVAGLFILNMAVSGILIAYSKQITALAEHDQRTVTAPAGATRL